MSQTKFEDLNARFNELSHEPEIFNCGEINLLKVFQHAVASVMNDQKDQLLVSIDMSPLLSGKIIPAIRRKRRRELYSHGKTISDSIPQRKYLLHSGGNCLKDENGNLVSSNSVNILKALGRENCYYVYKEYRGKSDPTGQDLVYSELTYYAENRPLEKAEKLLQKELVACLKRVESSSLIPQQYAQSFKNKLQLFFNSFRAWYLILSKSQPEKLYFITHYHQEGMLAAAQVLGIPKIELQHGLISENDYYYVYSEHLRSVINKALFGDKILLFGDYWGKVLDKGCEYPKAKREIIGAYQYRPKKGEEKLDSFASKYGLKDKKVVLITTQTTLPEYYYDYIKHIAPKLKEAHPDYLILIKPHPYQLGMDLLEKLEDFENVRLCAKTDDLMIALEFTDIQISLYSTTFYDAAGTGVINLSIYNHPQYRRYAELMIKEGIAHRLEWDDDPVAIAEAARSKHEPMPREYYYAPFREDFDKFV